MDCSLLDGSPNLPEADELSTLQKNEERKKYTACFV